jgi:hypothetical protein
VTVANVADPAPPADFFEPAAGTRYVGIQLRIVNVGTSLYSDATSNGAYIIDAQNQQHSSTFALTAAGPDLRSPAILPGDTRLGWITFEIPNELAISRFTLALDSGFADDVGDWSLTLGAPHDPAPAVLVPAAGPGDAITLEGLENVEVEVTLLSVIDPAPPAEFNTPDDDQRFVATQLKLRNVGSVQYSDSPSNGLEVIDSLGQTWNPTLLDSGAGPGFEGGSVTLAPGDERVGFVTFEVGATVTLTKLSMGLSSGFADTTGEWRLA